MMSAMLISNLSTVELREEFLSQGKFSGGSFWEILILEPQNMYGMTCTGENERLHGKRDSLFLSD